MCCCGKSNGTAGKNRMRPDSSCSQYERASRSAWEAFDHPAGCAKSVTWAQDMASPPSHKQCKWKGDLMLSHLKQVKVNWEKVRRLESPVLNRQTGDLRKVPAIARQERCAMDEGNARDAQIKGSNSDFSRGKAREASLRCIV